MITQEDYEAAKGIVQQYEIENGIRHDTNAFLIMPTDLLAGPTINYWMKLASHVLGSEHPKLVRARQHLALMLKWQGDHPLLVKHPD